MARPEIVKGGYWRGYRYYLTLTAPSPRKRWFEIFAMQKDEDNGKDHCYSRNHSIRDMLDFAKFILEKSGEEGKRVAREVAGGTGNGS